MQRNHKIKYQPRSMRTYICVGMWCQLAFLHVFALLTFHNYLKLCKTYHHSGSTRSTQIKLMTSCLAFRAKLEYSLRTCSMSESVPWWTIITSQICNWYVEEYYNHHYQMYFMAFSKMWEIEMTSPQAVNVVLTKDNLFSQLCLRKPWQLVSS